MDFPKWKEHRGNGFISSVWDGVLFCRCHENPLQGRYHQESLTERAQMAQAVHQVCQMNMNIIIKSVISKTEHIHVQRFDVQLVFLVLKEQKLQGESNARYSIRKAIILVSKSVLTSRVFFCCVHQNPADAERGKYAEATRWMAMMMRSKVF